MAEKFLGDIPGARFILHVYLPAVGAGVSREFPVACAPDGYKIKVQKVFIIPRDTITGAATNNMILSLRNRGTDATKTDVICSTTFDSGVNASALVRSSLGALSNQEVNSGEVLALNKTENGTGMAMPEMVMQIEFEVL